HNAKAGGESWSRSDLLKLVRRAGFEPRYFSLQRALDEPKLFERGEFVIVAGGDGAIRQAALALIGRKNALAPLPLGTANNIVRSFELPLRPEEIIDGWRKPRRRKFDVGVIEGPWGKRHFIEGVGVGLISRSIVVLEEIDEEAVYELKKRKHKLHRDICVAAALAREMRAIPAQLTFDGRTLSDEFLLVEVLNIRRAGPGVELAPQASPSDGRFDIVTATAKERPRLLKTLKARLKDSTQVRSMTTRRARHVQLEVHVPCEMRIDDDTLSLAADASVEITMKPGELEFLLPAK
ncbi:MAG: diacylglycerol/lipid kinase family protein, partial [Opitutaceae bacterium]